MSRTVLLALALAVSAALCGGPLHAQVAPQPAVAPEASPAPAAPPAAAAEDKAIASLASGQPCSDYIDNFPPCPGGKAERKRAHHVYDAAVKLLEDHKLEEALVKIREARNISPRDAAYSEQQRRVEAAIIADNMHRASEAVVKGDLDAAEKCYRRALELDPANAYAVQRLHDIAPPQSRQNSLHYLVEGGSVRLQPQPGRHSFTFKGSSAEFLQQFVRAYGLVPTVDESLASRQLKVNLDDVGWEDGSEIATRLCKALLIPMGEHEVLLAADTDENRRNLIHMELRTFYVSGASTAQELNDLFTSLRVLFDLHFVSLNPKTQTIVVRAPQATLDAVSRFMESLDSAKPVIMLDIKVYAISRDLTRGIGTTAPTQFTVFNIPSEINKLLTSSSYSQILSELSALGTSTSATTILAALLASGSSLGVSSPLTSPFATFGGGIGLSGVSIPSFGAKFNVTRGMTQTLDDMMVRTEHGAPATLKIGARYPIVTTLYSTGNSASSLLSALGISSSSLSSTIASALSSSSTPTSQFQYEDLGLVLKATPSVHGGLVTLDYDLQIRGLGATAANGQPIISNRSVKGVISTEDGESVVLAGMIDKEESNSLNGIPMLSSIPVVGNAFSMDSTDKVYSELMIVMTPHVVLSPTGKPAYIPVPTVVAR